MRGKDNSVTLLLMNPLLSMSPGARKLSSPPNTAKRPTLGHNTSALCRTFFKALRRAISVAPRGRRAQELLEITVARCTGSRCSCHPHHHRHRHRHSPPPPTPRAHRPTAHRPPPTAHCPLPTAAADAATIAITISTSIISTLLTQ